MAHPYADASLARKLGGNRSDKTLSEADLTQIIEESDSLVDEQTGKEYGGWSQSDTAAWPLVKMASRFFASAAIREIYDDNDRVSNDHYQHALDLCMRIVGIASGGTGIVIASQSRTTFPASSSGEVFYRHGFTSVGSSDSDFIDE